ncbi:basic salivary proline-rich protein 1-like [Perognathus longimembris pacificus]|uniref:basic salivary proline-rich protein 1-like n=1 Tax=Perognathus longimembris pacificus TaxID=214514 RepID=UPI0020198969|nr:basic salivary proline-rich protein 1-like [Perognathus longimembris pacificus]
MPVPQAEATPATGGPVWGPGPVWSPQSLQFGEEGSQPPPSPGEHACQLRASPRPLGQANRSLRLEDSEIWNGGRPLTVAGSGVRPLQNHSCRHAGRVTMCEGPPPASRHLLSTFRRTAGGPGPWLGTGPPERAPQNRPPRSGPPEPAPQIRPPEPAPHNRPLEPCGLWLRARALQAPRALGSASCLGCAVGGWARVPGAAGVSERGLPGPRAVGGARRCCPRPPPAETCGPRGSRQPPQQARSHGGRRGPGARPSTQRARLHALPGSPRRPSTQRARLHALPGSPRRPSTQRARLHAPPVHAEGPAPHAARPRRGPGSPGPGSTRRPSTQRARLHALPGSPRRPAPPPAQAHVCGLPTLRRASRGSTSPFSPADRKPGGNFS